MHFSSSGVGRWVDHPAPLRILTAVLFGTHLGLSLMGMDQVVLFLFYACTIVATGIAFSRESAWVSGIIVVLTITVHYSLQQQHMPLGAFLSMLVPLSFLLATVSRGQAKSYIDAKQNTLDIVLAMSKTLDSRDPYTASHSDHVARLAGEIAKAMRLPEKQREAIYIGGLLHDIGKIGVPEAVLTKPSRLTDAEYKAIQSHSRKGYDILKHIPQLRGNGVLDMVLHHHERYDGTGYPAGLKGGQIPLAARIMAVADSYDAMVSRRVYREHGLTVEQAIAQLDKGSGTQFDPEIAELFITMLRNDEAEFTLNAGDLRKNTAVNA